MVQIFNKKTKISDFCKTGSGGTPNRKKDSIYYQGSIPWIKSGELKNKTIMQSGKKSKKMAYWYFKRCNKIFGIWDIRKIE